MLRGDFLAGYRASYHSLRTKGLMHAAETDSVKANAKKTKLLVKRMVISRADAGTVEPWRMHERVTIEGGTRNWEGGPNRVR